MQSLNLTHLIDDAKCYETVRQMLLPSGICCSKCKSSSVIKRGKDETQPHRQRYRCKAVALTLMTLSTQYLQAIISRYECGYCACT